MGFVKNLCFFAIFIELVGVLSILFAWCARDANGGSQYLRGDSGSDMEWEIRNPRGRKLGGRNLGTSGLGSGVESRDNNQTGAGDFRLLASPTPLLHYGLFGCTSRPLRR